MEVKCCCSILRKRAFSNQQSARVVQDRMAVNQRERRESGIPFVFIREIRGSIFLTYRGIAIRKRAKVLCPALKGAPKQTA